MRRFLYVGVTVYAIAVVVVLVQLRSYEIARMIANGTWVLIGGLIVLRRSNVIGLMLVAAGALWTASTAAIVTAESLDDAGSLAAAGWVTLVGMVIFGPTPWIIAALWLVFPDGRTHSATDRRLLRWSGALAIAGTVASVFITPQVLPETEAYPHPFVDQDVAEALSDFVFPITPLLLLFGYFTAVKLVLRMRNGDPVERRQVRWIAVAVIANVTILLGNTMIAPFGSEDRAFMLIDAVGIILIPLAVGVAIMKYRLYEIDSILSKSVIYVGLAAMIVGLYAAVVIVPLLIIGASDDGGPGLLLPIAAAATVAVLFEPVRARLERGANRLVYGDRATPHEVLSQVTSDLPNSTDRDSTGDLAQLLVRGTGAERAVVWLVSDGMLTANGAFPDADESSHELAVGPVAIGGLIDDEVTESRPVLHRGELFGSLTIIKPHNDPITPEDRDLLTDVAAGAGPLLRNISLNNQLEGRAAEVRASRRRLIAAQDAERHRLERDLHDGAQQQVVALKVKLGIARTLAEREGADQIVTLVTSLADETQDAVDSLRAVAHGIYPPLLESEGLESALRSVERTSSYPVVIETSDLSRYPRLIEETAYFCVLESLQRLRMAGATGARVDLADRMGDLMIEIGVDGDVAGVDLTAVSDRIDAVGGRKVVDECPGGALRITNTLPAAATTSELT